MPETDETARVTMLWPADLKEKVREKVGVRGLTKFAVEAVERHYAYVYEPKSAPEKVEPPKATTPPAPEPEPDNFDEHAPMFTQGKSPEPEPEPEPVSTLEDIRKEHEQMDAEEAAGPPDLPHDTQAAPPKAANRPDLFKKLQEEGKSLGIDLKPASEVLKPHAKEEEPPAEEREKRGLPPSGMQTCPFHPEMAIGVNGECYKCTLEKNGTKTTPTPPRVQEPVETGHDGAADVCPNCGSVLIDGECWECM